MIKNDKLGEGTYGIVYSAVSPKSNKSIAIKRNLIEGDMSFIGVARELDILVKLRNHPYIIRIEEVSFDSPFGNICFSPLIGDERHNQKDDKIHFIFKQAAYDLNRFIYDAETINFWLIKRYMVNILLGTEYIHSQKIIHRDLKPSNVLIFGEEKDIMGVSNVAKICDFGLSKPYTHQGQQTPNTVTSWYRAPEITLDNPNYDYKVDVWSLGCILFEMIAKKPFVSESSDDNDRILSTILAKIPEELSVRKCRELVKSNKWRKVKILPTQYSRTKRNLIDQINLRQKGIAQFEKEAGKIDEFTDLLNNMLKFDWNERYTVTQCLNHVFFKDYTNLIQQTRTLIKQEKENKILIKNCIEREWMAQIVRDIFNNRASIKWYNTRCLFQAIDLYDRYLSAMFSYKKIPENAIESDLKGFIDTKYEAEIKFMTCIYICIKYFSSIHYPISYDSIVIDDYKSPEAMMLAEEFEASFIKNCLEYDIYRPTIYEAADNFGDTISDSDARDLIVIYTMNTSFSGKTPTELYKYYRDKLKNKGINALLAPIDN